MTTRPTTPTAKAASSRQILRFGRFVVEVTHADKVLFHEPVLTKMDLIRYYQTVSTVMLAHLRNRAITMQRFPEGIGSMGFYHKDAPSYFPEWIPRVKLPKEGGSVHHVVCNNTATLAYLVNQNCITPHTGLARVDEPNCPDLLVLDFDPSGTEFGGVRAGALAARKLLEDELGLTAFVKTTGSRGVHVCVPLDRRTPFEDVRAFARTIAELLVARHPAVLTTEHRKAERGGRVFVDYTRNGYAQTVVPPYAVRARRGAPVAAPITWDELQEPHIDARSFTVRKMSSRLDRVGDLWQGMFKHARSLNAALSRLEPMRAGAAAR